MAKMNKKFVATSLTAAMVATAIAPVAGATFTDSIPSWATKNVEYVAEKGIMKGSGDGTFNAGANITRAEVATLLANALKLELKEEATFADVEAGHWASKAIAAVVEAGIASGVGEGKFNPAGEITRQEAAVMFANAYKLALDENAIINLTDLSLVPTWAVNAVKILASQGVMTGKDGGKFAPADNITRAEVAALVHRSEVPAERVKVEYKYAVSAKAINAKQILVTFNEAVGTGASTVSNYAVTTVTNSLNNPVVSAAVQADGKSVILTLTDAYRVSTDVVVVADNIYKKGSIKEKFNRYSSVVTVSDTVAPSITAVKSTTSTNAAQVVKVTFNEPLKTTPTFKVNGNTVAAGNIILTGETYSLSGLNLSTDKVHTLEVLSLEDYAENKVTYLKQSFSVVKDTTAATGKVSMAQDNLVEIKFDKAMNLASLQLVDVLYYDATAKEYKLLALDKLTEVSGTPTYNASLSKDQKTAYFQISASEKTKLFGLNDSTEELVVKVKNGVVDAAGNAVTPFEQRVVTTEDTTGPALENVTFAKNSKGEVEKLYFHFDEEIAAAISVTDLLDEAKLIITNKATNKVEASNEAILGAAPTVELATDGSTIIVTLDTDAGRTNLLKAGSYEFTLVKELVSDTSFGANKNKQTAKTVDFGTASSQLVVSSVVVNEGSPTAAKDNKVTVTFSAPVTTASAINPANYMFNGVVLPADTVITYDNSQQVSFTLPAGLVSKTDLSAVVNISGIVAQNSSLSFKNYVGTEIVYDNTAPVATASLLVGGKIQVSFEDAGTVTPIATDFTKVIINGKELNGAPTGSVETLPNGEKVVVLSVAAATANDFNSTGFTYQYIDVDGDATLDFTKDIVLRSVQATTAPASWTSVADLNLVETVVIKTGATTATKDDSDYTTTSGTGNLLKANNSIKVK